MATKIVTKNSSTASAVPTASDLVQGELAVNVADKRLFTEDNGGAIVELGTNPSGNVTFQDNGKAIFGAGSDLQIYHDGNNSFVADEGTGALVLQSNGSFTLIQNSSGVANARFDSAGATSLRYNGAEKLATTSTGIDVTGNLQATGYLAVDGASGNTGAGTDRWIGGDGTAGTWFYNVPTGSNHYFAVNNANKLAINSTGIDVTGTVTADGLTVDGSTAINNPSSQQITFSRTGSSVGSGTIGADVAQAMGIWDTDNNKVAAFYQNQDVAFYEDTGTTAKLFWDASAESLGIGTSSPATGLHLEHSNAGATSGTIRIQDRDSQQDANQQTGGIEFYTQDATNPTEGVSTAIKSFSASSSGGAYLTLSTTDVNTSTLDERMRIDSSGNIRLTGTAPNSEDNISTINFFNSSSGINLASITGKRTAGGTNYGSLIFNTTSSGTASEAMRIDSSGNLLVGGTSPEALGSTTITQAGQLISRVDNAYAVEFRRDNGDGDIAVFRKGGTTVGSIGTSGGDLYIGTGDTALRFLDASDFIYPVSTATGTARDNAIDLGYSTGRFKDLYLSSKTKYQAAGGNQHSIGADANDLIIRSETAGSETARFTYGGNLLVGTTSPISAGKISAQAVGTNPAIVAQGASDCFQGKTTQTSGNSYFAYWVYNGSAVGSITSTGSSTSYNTSSDQRLKENIADADDAGSKVDSIQVRKFDWIADGSHQDYGMIAQELLEVVPEAVSVPEDSEEMMGVDYSKLVPMLIKEIQSLRNRVAQLEE